MLFRFDFYFPFFSDYFQVVLFDLVFELAPVANRPLSVCGASNAYRCCQSLTYLGTHRTSQAKPNKRMHRNKFTVDVVEQTSCSRKNRTNTGFSQSIRWRKEITHLRFLTMMYSSACSSRAVDKRYNKDMYMHTSYDSVQICRFLFCCCSTTQNSGVKDNLTLFVTSALRLRFSTLAFVTLLCGSFFLLLLLHRPT